MCLETISVNNDSRETFINRVQKYADDKEELSEEELNTSEFNHSQIDLATHLRYLVLLCDTSDDYSGSPYEVIKAFEHGNVAITKVYYRAKSYEIDGVENPAAKYNYGLLTYNTAHRTYVAFEFDSALTDENTIRDIAESIVWN